MRQRSPRSRSYHCHQRKTGRGRGFSFYGQKPARRVTGGLIAVRRANESERSEEHTNGARACLRALAAPAEVPTDIAPFLVANKQGKIYGQNHEVLSCSVTFAPATAS